MTAVGNDIVALQYTNPERTVQKKFYFRIICNDELTLFKSNNFNSLSFRNFIWLAWSVKESVYKIYKRTNYQATFSPTKIIIEKIVSPVKCRHNSFHNSSYENISFCKEECYCCEVMFDSIVFYTKSLVYNDLIFTVANDATCFNNIQWGIKNIYDDTYAEQSKNVRDFVLKRLNMYFLNDDLNIEKADAGYPFIRQKKNIPLSFTHHGNFVGYAFVTEHSIKNPE